MRSVADSHGGEFEMKREILFRGLDRNGEWKYGDLLQPKRFVPTMKGQHTKAWILKNWFGNGGWLARGFASPVQPETVGQYTGLKDRNGVKIFEGDIVSTQRNNREVVEWDAEDCCFEANFSSYRGYGNSSYFLEYVKEKMVTVIGNIHQHKHLLEHDK